MFDSRPVPPCRRLDARRREIFFLHPEQITSGTGGWRGASQAAKVHWQIDRRVRVPPASSDASPTTWRTPPEPARGYPTAWVEVWQVAEFSKRIVGITICAGVILVFIV